jgi:hypothetical protein
MNSRSNVGGMWSPLKRILVSRLHGLEQSPTETIASQGDPYDRDFFFICGKGSRSSNTFEVPDSE